ncbi:MAG: IS630 family transposase, partial [Nocardioidaceae bacterium]
MRSPAPALAMSDAQRDMLAKLAVSQTAPIRQVQRAKVLVLAGQGVANSRIAEQVGVTVSTVR